MFHLVTISSIFLRHLFTACVVYVSYLLYISAELCLDDHHFTFMCLLKVLQVNRS